MIQNNVIRLMTGANYSDWIEYLFKQMTSLRLSDTHKQVAKYTFTSSKGTLPSSLRHPTVTNNIVSEINITQMCT